MLHLPVDSTFYKNNKLFCERCFYFLLLHENKIIKNKIVIKL